MGIIRADSFSMGVSGGISSAGNTWERRPGPGNRTAIRHTGTTAAGTLASQGGGNLPRIINIHFYAMVSGPSNLGARGNGIGFVESDGMLHGLSISPRGAVGSEIVKASGASAWTIKATFVTQPDTWYWWAIIGTWGAASGGSYRIYCDGILVAETAGDTSPTLTAFGHGVRVGSAQNTSNPHLTVSDWIERDDEVLMAPSRVDRLTLSATTLAGFTGSDGNQVDNHLLLNDVGPTPDLNTYVQAASAGLVDTYTVNPLPAGTGTILAVQTTLIGASPDATLPTKLTINTGESIDLLPTAGTSASYIANNNPTTGSAWTKAEVDSMTVGIKT